MALKGSKQTPEHSEKIRQANLGRKMSSSGKKKVSLARKGKPPWNKGLKGYNSGEKSHKRQIITW